MHLTRFQPLRLAGLVLVVSATLTASSALAGDDEGVATLADSEPGVATLSDADPSPGASTAAATNPADPEEAFLAFAACMRENGIDMPDPQFDAGGQGGGFRIVRPGSGDGQPIDFQSEEFQAAQETCDDLLEGLVGTQDPEAIAERQEAMLAFAQCMRENGVDMPDPDVGGGPGFGVRIGGPDSDSDIDPGSPEFQAAMETCQPALGEGPGRPVTRSDP
jgi:hypothetical protein